MPDLDDILEYYSPSRYKDFCKELEEKKNELIKFFKEKKDWIGIKHWLSDYIDKEGFHSFFKVDSHRLNQEGNKIKEKKKRYPFLIPG